LISIIEIRYILSKNFLSSQEPIEFLLS
jgi:hypothetical protein